MVCLVVLTFDNRVCPFHLILSTLMLSSRNCTLLLPLYFIPVKSRKQQIKADVTNDVRPCTNDRSAPKSQQTDENREIKKQNREGESNCLQKIGSEISLRQKLPTHLASPMAPTFARPTAATSPSTAGICVPIPNNHPVSTQSEG